MNSFLDDGYTCSSLFLIVQSRGLSSAAGLVNDPEYTKYRSLRVKSR